MKTVVVIPCRNEGSSIAEVVHGVRKTIWCDIVVCDDKSIDKTVENANKAGAYVVTHYGEHGAGFNTKTGIEVALARGADIVITMDGDGQHNPVDIPKLIEPIEKGLADIVVGTRFVKGKCSPMPAYRKVGINIITWLYNIGNRNKVSDAQCCYRAYRKEALRQMEITEPGFVYSVETLVKLRKAGLRIMEVPVDVIYHKNYMLNSSMSPLQHGFIVALGTVKWRLKVELLTSVKSCIFGLLTKYVEHPLERRGLGRIKIFDLTYKFIFGLAVPKMQKEVSINGYKLIVRTGGKWGIGGIAKSILYSKEYEPQTTEVFKAVVKPNMRVVDVGANVGYYTMLLSKLVGENGKVWSFEPEPRNFDNLTENIALNNYHNVTPARKAVSDIAGSAKFYVSESERAESSLVPNLIRGKEETIEVDRVVLDDEIEGTVDFLKTDTEGNELAVLKGAKRLLLQDDVKIVVEVFPQSYEVAGYDLSNLCEIFNSYGFKYIYVIDERKKRFILMKSVNDWKEYSGNILCSKKEVVLEQVY